MLQNLWIYDTFRYAGLFIVRKRGWFWNILINFLFKRNHNFVDDFNFLEHFLIFIIKLEKVSN